MKLWFLENSWRGILELLDFTRKGVNQELYGMSLVVNSLVWVNNNNNRFLFLGDNINMTDIVHPFPSFNFWTLCWTLRIFQKPLNPLTLFKMIFVYRKYIEVSWIYWHWWRWWLKYDIINIFLSQILQIICSCSNYSFTIRTIRIARSE